MYVWTCVCVKGRQVYVAKSPNQRKKKYENEINEMLKNFS